MQETSGKPEGRCQTTPSPSAALWHDSAMSYDLAVWEGERPADDKAATKFFLERIVPQIEEYDLSNAVLPTPRIRAYVEALLGRWPDKEVVGDEVLNEDSPWSVGGLMGEAIGWFVYFPMQWAKAAEASAFAAEVAQQHGLICYDPQTEHLRP
jgi:hypothetical protein